MTDVAELGGAAGGSAAVGLADDLGRKSVIYIYILYKNVLKTSKQFLVICPSDLAVVPK